MQNYGYTHKNKSLEEILRDARKKEPELLGYNEEPIKVESDICAEMNNLKIGKERDANISFRRREISIDGTLNSSQRTAGDTMFFKDDVNIERNHLPKVAVQNGCLPKGTTQKNNKKEYHGNAKSESHTFIMHRDLSIRKSNETCKLWTLTSLTCSYCTQHLNFGLISHFFVFNLCIDEPFVLSFNHNYIFL